MSFVPRWKVGTVNQWKFKSFRRSSRSKRIIFVCREEDSKIWWKSLPGRRDEMECELERGQRICPYCNVRHIWRCQEDVDRWRICEIVGDCVLTRAGKALTKVEIFMKNSWKCVDCSNFFTKTCLTNHYFSRDPHFVILAWVQSWNIFEILMKVCSPPEFFHKNMSQEQLSFMWSTFRYSRMGTKLKYVWKTHETVQSARNFFTKTWLTNNYFSLDPHFAILAWVQSSNIHEKHVKLWSPPEFFHKNMSEEQLLFTWSIFRDSSMSAKLKYFWNTHESV